MHGISSIAGNRTNPWVVKGKTYLLSPMRLRDFGEKEAYILSRRVNVPGSDSKTASHVTFEEEAVFDMSQRGLLFNLWRALRTEHRKFDLKSASGPGCIEEALELVADVFEEACDEKGASTVFQEVLVKLAKAEEKDLQKNSDGPGKKKRKSKSTTKKTASPGPDSLPDSKTDTTGPTSK